MSRRGVQSPAPGPMHTDADDDAVEVDTKIEQAWAALLPFADRIADNITARLRANDPGWFQAASPELLADVRGNAREQVRQGLRTLSGQVAGSGTNIAMWRDAGRRRARQAISLEVVLNGYNLGTRVLWEALVEHHHSLARRGVECLGDPLLLVAGQRLWLDLDVQSAVLIDAHRRETAQIARRDQQLIQSLLDRLLDPQSGESTIVDEAAVGLGVAAGEPVACVAAPLDDAVSEPLRQAQDRLERAGRISFWSVRQGTHFGLVPLAGLQTTELVDLLGSVAEGRIGVAVAAEGVAGFADAHHLATRAARTLPRGVSGVVHVADRLPELLLGGSPEVTALLVEQTVAPLMRGGAQHSTLISTLETLMRCHGSATRAAEELYCHRNTVLYRIKQIEQLTGRSLRSPRDRLMFGLGLLAVGRSETPHAAP